MTKTFNFDPEKLFPPRPLLSSNGWMSFANPPPDRELVHVFLQTEEADDDGEEDVEFWIGAGAWLADEQCLAMMDPVPDGARPYCWRRRADPPTFRFLRQCPLIDWREI